jgi:hypothetical protein
MWMSSSAFSRELEMPDLLMHSMAEFSDLILPALSTAGARHVVEIGAEAGTMTRLLLDHTQQAGGSFVSIDPSPDPAVEALFASASHARLVRDTSIAAISSLNADAWIIDGDHNWWTVYHESQAIWERVREKDGDFLVFYHDVGWPWGRRDLYYAPDRIPPSFRHPHAFDRGVTLDVPEAVMGGFRGEGRWACALREGGPKNGVLTAIEDFVIGKEERLLWAQIPAVFGLGVLFERDASWSTELAGLLGPYHLNPLLARLERNRLDCYLRVLELQDGLHEAVH